MIALASRAPGPLEMVEQFLRILTDELGVEFAALYLVKPDGTLGERLQRSRGKEPTTASPRPGGMAEQILKTGQGQYVADTQSDPRANPALVQAGVRSYIGLPLKAEGQTAGILFLHSTFPDAFRGQEERLQSIAGIMAVPLLRKSQGGELNP